MLGKNDLEKAGQNYDFSPNYSIAEIGGCSRVLIENHRGVRRYDSGCICVNTGYGFLQVSGNCLRVSYMTKERILIRGNLDAVHIFRECTNG